jgi:hypothetical protein
MEPKLPSSNRGSEQLPGTFAGGGEYAPSIPTPEQLPERKHEAVETRSETAPAVPIQPTVLPTPVQVPEPIADTNTPASDGTGVPLVAADDDLIEKEWVDKAKAIVIETKDDPYQREQKVSQLQVDYLRKRYGKELGAS